MDPSPLDVALQAAGLSTDSLEEIPVDGCDETVLRYAWDPDRDWETAWHTLRASVRPVGWCPVFYDDFDEHGTVSRHDMQGPDGLDVSPTAILHRVTDFEADRWIGMLRHRSRSLETDDSAERRLAQSSANLSLAEAHHILGTRVENNDLERWILDQEVAAGSSNDANAVPQDRGAAGFLAKPFLYLLPAAVAWAPGAYLGGFEWGYPHTDLKTHILRRWNRRWGAEMMASWGGVEFTLFVDRPPTTIDDAWQVAMEIMALWPDTASWNFGSTMVAMTREMVGSNRWGLRYQP